MDDRWNPDGIVMNEGTTLLSLNGIGLRSAIDASDTPLGHPNGIGRVHDRLVQAMLGRLGGP